VNWTAVCAGVGFLAFGLGLAWLISSVVAWATVRGVRDGEDAGPPTSIEVPGGIVEFKGTLTEAEADEFRRRWAEATATSRWRLRDGEDTVWGQKGP
jgi:hypothetical protein